jgi:glycosyltransferase involved in cell wall biosynthesis
VVPYGTTGPEGEPSLLRGAFAEAFPAIAKLPFLLFLGRIHPKKGCDLLLEAYARVAPTNLHLVLAGPDETGWRTELDPLVNRLGIADRVHWTGMIRGQLKWGALLTAQAFILPSHQENFGIAVADALACGVIPLISTQVNIAPDVVADGAGVMEPDTLAGTENLIRRFLALTSDQLTQMRSRAIDCYRRRYGLSGAAETLYLALGIAPKAAITAS